MEGYVDDFGEGKGEGGGAERSFSYGIWYERKERKQKIITLFQYKDAREGNEKVFICILLFIRYFFSFLQ